MEILGPKFIKLLTGVSSDWSEASDLLLLRGILNSVR